MNLCTKTVKANDSLKIKLTITKERSPSINYCCHYEFYLEKKQTFQLEIIRKNLDDKKLNEQILYSDESIRIGF